MKSGIFIVIEGIDGTGKSTLARNLQIKIAEATTGFAPLVTHEPSSWQLERTIRSYFKREAGPLSAEEMAQLFTADRILHMDQTVRPALSDGQVVICDRHKLSTLVYQSACGAAFEFLSVLQSGVSGPEPDLTILLTVDPKLGRSRLDARSSELDSYERDIQRQEDMQLLYLENLPAASFIIDTCGISCDRVADIAAREALIVIDSAAARGRLV